MKSRLYRITIQTPSMETIFITPPFTVKIKVDRKKMASTNKANITIYNLGKATRNKLYKDRYDMINYWQIKIEAGYGDNDRSDFSNMLNLPEIFRGNIYECNSQKDGNNWITSIDAFDGMYGIQNGFVSQTFNAGTTNKNIVQSLIGTMSKLTPGSLGSPTDGSITKGQVIFGQSKKELNTQTNGQWFIDNEKVHVLGDDEVIGDQIIKLDSSLLRKTPKRSETFLDVDCLFFPEANIGQIIAFESEEEIYNGQYACWGLSHDFNYSGASCEDSGTVLNLYCGAAVLVPVV